MLIYAAITIVLPAIDTWRMKRTWGKVGNINHWLSYLLAGIGIVAAWVVSHGLVITWAAIPFVVACIAIRGMFYDPVLNILVNFFVFPRAIDYISGNSNSLNESRLTKIPFWWRRIGYGAVLGIVILINHFL